MKKNKFRYLILIFSSLLLFTGCSAEYDLNILEDLTLEEALYVRDGNTNYSPFSMIGNLENDYGKDYDIMPIGDGFSCLDDDCNNAEYIYDFALTIKGASIEMLTDAIINTYDIEYIIKFAKFIKNAPVDKLQEYISKSEKYLKLIEEENYKTLIDLVKSNNYEQIEENKKEFATIFNDNKPKKLIKKKIK